MEKLKKYISQIQSIEILSFSVIILFLWLDEILDLPHLFLNAPATPVNITECVMETVYVIILAFVVFPITKSHLLKMEIMGQTIAEKNEQLKRLNLYKDNFFSILSHDLKNDFTVIIGYSELLKEEWDYMEKNDAKKIMDSIYRASQKSYSLFENLLKWASLNFESGTVRMREVSVGKLVENLLAEYKVIAAKKQIIIQNTIDPEIKVKAEEHLLYSIFQNLVNNAIKFTQMKGTITIGCGQRNDHWDFFVKDNGVGIPNEILKNLFQLESKTSSLGTEGEKGSGFGLLLCKDMAQRNGGHLEVESIANEGSVFHLLLPLGK